jgi:hypothetical protein
MRTRRGLGRWAAAVWLVALLVAACTAHGVINTSSDGLRTFAVIRNPDGSSVPCPAFGLTNPVTGILEGQAGAREPVWLRADDGRHLSGPVAEFSRSDREVCAIKAGIAGRHDGRHELRDRLDR